MGDLVCADIALEELGRDARDFLWLIEERSRPWAEYRGLSHLCYDREAARVLEQVWGRHALVVNTEQRFGLAQALACGARSRGGRLLSFATNRGARWSDTVVAYDWRDRHETVEFARLFAAALGLPEPVDARRERTRRFPAEGPPLVLVAGLQSRSRRLGVEAWAALIGTWHGGRSFEIAAGPADEAFADELAARFPERAIRFRGSFAELCDRLARSEETLTMDGGPVHIASFFGVPTSALFTSGRDRKWHPLGEGSRVLRRHDLPCQPCTRFGQVPPCPHGYACLELGKGAWTGELDGKWEGKITSP
jgi:ADP-heptose:LPS heptosyltransferase